MSAPLVLFVPGYPEAVPARQLTHRFAHALAVGGRGPAVELASGTFDAVQYVAYVDESALPEKQLLSGRATTPEELKFYGEAHQSILEHDPASLRPPASVALHDPLVAHVEDPPIGTIRTFFATLWEYATDKGFRYQAQDLLRQRLVSAKGRPLLLVAHGMGAVLAYDTLFKTGLALPPVELLTLGAPLGLSVTQRRFKAKAGEEGYFPVPERVIAWTNVSAPHDPICADEALGDQFRWPNASMRVDDRLAQVDSGWPFHRWEGYLRSSVVRETVADFMGRATQPKKYPLRAG